MRDLAEERDSWQRLMQEGGMEIAILGIYKKNRMNSRWRTNKTVEQLCEYIISLEGRINRKNWTTKQVDTLRRIYPDKELTISQIAREVGHQERATYQMARRLGLKRGSEW